MVRLGAALFCVTLGLGGGYLAWGGRAAALAQALDELSLEYDFLRIQFRNSGATDSLHTLSGQLREQGEMLAQQARALQRIAGEGDEQIALRECTGVQVKMQEELEGCLFARAELERAAAAAKQAAAPPRPGKQTFTETIEIPQIPEALKKAERDEEEDSDRDRDDEDKDGDKAGLEAGADAKH
jgi:hypothetical protein